MDGMGKKKKNLPTQFNSTNTVNSCLAMRKSNNIVDGNHTHVKIRTSQHLDKFHFL